MMGQELLDSLDLHALTRLVSAFDIACKSLIFERISFSFCSAISLVCEQSEESSSNSVAISFKVNPRSLARQMKCNLVMVSLGYTL